MEADCPPAPGAACIAHLENGGTVVTASRRLARLLRQRYDAAQVAAGRKVWATANVMPLDSWLVATWSTAALERPDAPQLLGDHQAEQPWREAIEDSEPIDSLLATADFAALARAAWLELRQYRGDLAAVARERLTADQEAFLGWARRVEGRLEARRWLDPGLLCVAVGGLPQAALAGEPLLLAGFAQLRPDQTELVDALRAAGRSAELLPIAGKQGAAACHEAANPAAETTAMLAWARERLERDPTGQLALIVPDLPARRDALERALAAALEPVLEHPGARAHSRAFDLAGGPPLSAQRVVADALDAVAATRHSVPLDVVSRLLRSPYLAGSRNEAAARLGFEGWLRDRAKLAEWPVARLAVVARARGAGQFADSLQAARAAWTESGRRPAGEWARTLGRVLSAWGWPGQEERSLASDEYQAARALRDALDTLASLDLVAAMFDGSGVRAEFRRLCTAPFQPERGPPVVVVLDRLEAPGIDFAGLWVAGLTAANWPRAATPNPLLPPGLQRHLGMPGASPEDRRQDAEAVTHAWLGAAREVVLSWPAHQDEARVEGSSLLPPLPSTAAVTPAEDQAAALFARRAELQVLLTDAAPPLSPAAARGGAKLLELQAKCPFRAFAELRLGSKAFEEPAPGVDRRIRGIALHHALELFWNEALDQDGLLALTPAERTERIDAKVAQALRETLPEDTGARARQLEADWQARAMAALLDLDAARTPFAVVGREQRLIATLAGLPLDLRVDRVDRVGERLVLLDYKSGDASTRGWKGARMDAPQLPLYAVLHRGDVAAIAFAQPAGMRAVYSGVGADADLLPRLKEAHKFAIDRNEKGLSWPELKARWQAWLGRLAEQHLAGEARVDPKQPDTCRHCHLDALCRVRGRFDAEAVEAGDGDDE